MGALYGYGPRLVSRDRSSSSSANSASRLRNTAVPLAPVSRQYSRRNRCCEAFRSTVIRIGFAGLPCSFSAAVSSAESSPWERCDPRSIVRCSLLVRSPRRRKISDALPVPCSLMLPPLPEVLLLPAHILQDSHLLAHQTHPSKTRAAGFRLPLPATPSPP